MNNSEKPFISIASAKDDLAGSCEFGVNNAATVGKPDADLTQPGSPDVHGWQPIETAPKKEYEPILLYNECWGMTFGAIQIAWWVESNWVFASEMNIEPDDDIDFNPTHWMPLPKGPSNED